LFDFITSSGQHINELMCEYYKLLSAQLTSIPIINIPYQPQALPDHRLFALPQVIESHYGAIVFNITCSKESHLIQTSADSNSSNPITCQSKYSMFNVAYNGQMQIQQTITTAFFLRQGTQQRSLKTSSYN
jgi:hypothetical protein